MSDDPNYERLTAMDTTFLVLEKPHARHFTSRRRSSIDAGGLATECGGIDVDAYRAATEAVLHQIPRYRQKLEWIPVVGHPVWVDDAEFNLDYHIRHTSLPRPGTTGAIEAAVGAHHGAAARSLEAAVGGLGGRRPRGRIASR